MTVLIPAMKITNLVIWGMLHNCSESHLLYLQKVEIMLSTTKRSHTLLFEKDKAYEHQPVAIYF